jgi:hypothetical protein
MYILFDGGASTLDFLWSIISFFMYSLDATFQFAISLLLLGLSLREKRTAIVLSSLIVGIGLIALDVADTAKTYKLLFTLVSTFILFYFMVRQRSLRFFVGFLLGAVIVIVTEQLFVFPPLLWLNLDPQTILENRPMLLLVTGFVLIGKLLVTTLIARFSIRIVRSGP